jgi:hypothetical protein
MANINMDLGEIGWGVVDWIGLAQDRGKWRALVNSIINLSVPKNKSGNLSSGLTGALSSNAQLHRVSYGKLQLQFLAWVVTESIWPVGHYLVAYCISPG